MLEFTTHTGEKVTGVRLADALNVVASQWVETAHAIRKGPYAAHVTEETKEARLKEVLTLAEKIRAGEAESFTVWQQVNTVLTGECVALFSND